MHHVNSLSQPAARAWPRAAPRPRAVSLLRLERPRALRLLPLLLLAVAAHPVVSRAAGEEAVFSADVAWGERVRVESVADGATLLLADGRELRLAGLLVPRSGNARAALPPEPYAEDARHALGALAIGEPIRLAYGGARTDRYRRILAHAVLDDGVWLQGELLRRGLARVAPFTRDAALVPEMLGLEREARAAGRGLWAHPDYRVRAPEEAGRHLDSFQLVEGRVREVALTRSFAYLNFGADWRSDFTVRIARSDLRRFRAAGLDPVSLEGRRLRVRGWVEALNGPMIDADFSAQIEVLPE